MASEIRMYSYYYWKLIRGCSTCYEFLRVYDKTENNYEYGNIRFKLEVISVNMVVAVHNHLNSLPISELFLKDSLPRRLLL